MYIPESLIEDINKNTGPMENRFFEHAFSALKALNKITADTYCYDDISRAANVLERIYKGFLQAAVIKDDWYQLPEEDFLDKNHDILGMLKEIKRSFPEVFPRQERDDWIATQKFLSDLRKAYSESRYITCPSYDEFSLIRRYVNQQTEVIKEYLESGRLEEIHDLELREDY